MQTYLYFGILPLLSALLFSAQEGFSLSVCDTISSSRKAGYGRFQKKKKKKRKSRKSYFPLFESSSLSHTQYKNNIFLIKITLIALGRPLVVTRPAAGAQFVYVFNAQL